MALDKHSFKMFQNNLRRVVGSGGDIIYIHSSTITTTDSRDESKAFPITNILIDCVIIIIKGLLFLSK